MGREPLALRATKTLKDAIIAGQYFPGERLTEESLARKLGVSRNVVREAFHRLEAEGLLQNDHYKGRSVVRLTPEDMAEMVSLRAVLECHAISLAIKNAAQSDIQDFRNRGRALCNAKDYKSYLEADLDLHRAIARCSRSVRLGKFLNELWGPFFTLRAHQDFLPVFGSSPERIVLQEIRWELERSPRGHQLIVEKLCQRDLEGAQEAMRNHILSWTEWKDEKVRLPKAGS